MAEDQDGEDGNPMRAMMEDAMDQIARMMNAQRIEGLCEKLGVDANSTEGRLAIMRSGREGVDAIVERIMDLQTDFADALFSLRSIGKEEMAGLCKALDATGLEASRHHECAGDVLWDLGSAKLRATVKASAAYFSAMSDEGFRMVHHSDVESEFKRTEKAT